MKKIIILSSIILSSIILILYCILWYFNTISNTGIRDIGNSYIAYWKDGILDTIKLNNNNKIKNGDSNYFIFSKNYKVIKNRFNPFLKAEENILKSLNLYVSSSFAPNTNLTTYDTLEEELNILSEKYFLGYRFTIQAAERIECGNENLVLNNNDDNTYKLFDSLCKPNNKNSFIFLDSLVNFDGQRINGFSSYHNGRLMIFVSTFDPKLILHEILHKIHESNDKAKGLGHDDIRLDTCLYPIMFENKLGCEVYFKVSDLLEIHGHERIFINNEILLPFHIKDELCCQVEKGSADSILLNKSNGIDPIDNKMIDSLNEFDFPSISIALSRARNSILPSDSPYRQNLEAEFNALYEGTGIMTVEAYIIRSIENYKIIRKNNAEAILKYLKKRNFKDKKILNSCLELMNSNAFPLRLIQKNGIALNMNIKMGDTIKMGKITITLNTSGILRIEKQNGTILYNELLYLFKGNCDKPEIKIKDCVNYNYKIYLDPWKVVPYIDKVFVNSVKTNLRGNFIHSKVLPRRIELHFKSGKILEHIINTRRFSEDGACNFKYNNSIILIDTANTEVNQPVIVTDQKIILLNIEVDLKYILIELKINGISQDPTITSIELKPNNLPLDIEILYSKLDLNLKPEEKQLSEIKLTEKDIKGGKLLLNIPIKEN